MFCLHMHVCDVSMGKGIVERESIIISSNSVSFLSAILSYCIEKKLGKLIRP